MLAPMNKFFLDNFLYYWLPQAVVFILLYILKLRLAVITGAAIALTISLIGYSMFKDSMAWIGYLFIVPASFLGATNYGLSIKSEISISYDSVIINSIFFTTVGIGIVQFILCSTVMYCGW